MADIIDNSITAGATNIRLLTDIGPEGPLLGILDDGAGMTEDELIAAMRPGSRSPTEERDTPDLGRFGLGLKSASFSQCRRLTVVSRRDGIVSAAIWDLDEVVRTNTWAIEVMQDPSPLPWFRQLRGSGTLVIWEKIDRIADGVTHDKDRIAEIANERISNAEYHIRLVFHRFMSVSGRKALSISLNGRTLKPIDPFAESNAATMRDQEDVLHLRQGDVVIQSITLPHHRQMSQQAWEELGGPEGHLKSQGFYLYRGRRLIQYGSWFGLARQTELTKLSRVRIDIPNSMDSLWKIDVKKSSAQMPPVVRDRLRKLLDRISLGSRRTYRKRGQKLVDEARMPMWSRIQTGEQISYCPNEEHPVFLDFADRLDPDLREAFMNCIRLVGSSLPVDTLHSDMAGHAEKIRGASAGEATVIQGVEAMFKRGLAPGDVWTILRDVEPFASHRELVERIIVGHQEVRSEV
ncbi:ATP-binding protein [Leisingera thetidis]|uniref:ATP-binding protein n=1 Tax=Leisingera thetidis TaxID=2930199 RepID=UPI0021F7B05C|nr:ATP-binding protein [Leisingera thetidis]